MSWSRRFRVRQFLRGSIWFVPVLGGAAGSLCGIAAAEADRHYSLPEGWTYSAGTAQAVLASVVGASVGLTGFVVTVAVLIVQMATGTFSARYMRIFYRDGLLKAVLAVLVGTLTFSYALLRRVEQDSVPSLGVTLAGFFLAAGVLLFLVFLDRSIHRLRPVAVAALVAQAGRRSFEAMIREAKAPDAPMHAAGRVRRRHAADARRREPAGGSRPGDRRPRARSLCARARLPDRRPAQPWATSCRRERRCSRCTAETGSTPRRRGACGRWSCSGSSGRSSRTPLSRFA